MNDKEKFDKVVKAIQKQTRKSLKDYTKAEKDNLNAARKELDAKLGAKGYTTDELKEKARLKLKGQGIDL